MEHCCGLDGNVLCPDKKLKKRGQLLPVGAISLMGNISQTCLTPKAYAKIVKKLNYTQFSTKDYIPSKKCDIEIFSVVWFHWYRFMV